MLINYQKKLFIFTPCIFVAITCGLGLLVYQALNQTNLATIERQLQFTSSLIDDQLQEKTDDLILIAKESSSLAKLSKTIKNNQKQQQHDLLQVLAHEFQTDRALLIAPSMSILADTNLKHQSIQAFPFTKLYKHALTNKPFNIVLPINEQVYHWVLFPIAVADDTYWLAFGTEIDKIFRSDLETISPLDIHLSFAHLQVNKQWHYDQDTFELLGTHFNKRINDSLSLLHQNKKPSYFIQSQDYVVYFLPLKQYEESPAIVALLMCSVAESFQPYYKLLIQIIALFLIAFILLFAGLIILGRKYRQALYEIVDYVAEVDKGEYTHRLSTDGKGVVGKLSLLLNNMVTKMSHRERELIHKTRYDTVTELPNKAFLIDQLNRLLNDPNCVPFATILVSIDRFSHINHALGHRVADRLLHHVGARIVSAFQDANFIGNLSGNSFVIIMTDTTVTDAEALADRIHDLFESPFSVYTVTIDLNAYVGFSFFPEDGDESDILIQRADVALYLAMYSADHYAIYEPQHDPHQFNKLSLMSELKEGLQNNELVVYYQPKIDLKTEKTIGVEALVRWVHPHKGFMSPALFIPLAEETGHIKKITAWLLKKTFEQSAAWQKKNIPLKISVNLSVKDILNKHLFNTISNLLQTYQINPQNIVFEITESAFIKDPNNAYDAIMRLKALGFTFAIDDFGTGYSSMSYLKQLPVNELKIDKTFIEEIIANDRDTQIVQSAIKLGHSLGLTVVAEGIEDEDTYELLHSLDCDIAQGFFMCKPLPIDEFENWLKTSQWGLR